MSWTASGNLKDKPDPRRIHSAFCVTVQMTPTSPSATTSFLSKSFYRSQIPGAWRSELWPDHHTPNEIALTKPGLT
jgi:hypothetical protein